MTKEFYNKMLLMSSLCLLSFSGPVSAQCVTPPTCSELGYTKSVTDCEGHTFLKCPFDQSVGYCDLGTSSTPVPEPEPTPTYKVGDNYSLNGSVIGKVIKVSNSAVTVASIPRSQSNPSVDGVNSYCESLTLGGVFWSAPIEKNCDNIMKSYTEIGGEIFSGIVVSKGDIVKDSTYCGSSCICYSSVQSSTTYYYTCIAGFSI